MKYQHRGISPQLSRRMQVQAVEAVNSASHEEQISQLKERIHIIKEQWDACRVGSEKRKLRQTWEELELALTNQVISSIDPNDVLQYEERPPSWFIGALVEDNGPMSSELIRSMRLYCDICSKYNRYMIINSDNIYFGWICWRCQVKRMSTS